jgi:undecaprenyl diphosphate synthase
MRLEQRVKQGSIPRHLAIIMDGNGRWAKRRRMPRTYGHKQGSVNLKDITIACHDLGIQALSVYAFSTENWRRPKEEIDYLMNLPKEFEETFRGRFEEHDIRVVFSGRRDRFPDHVLDLMNRVEEKTKDRKGLVLNICFDYGSRHELVEAMQAIGAQCQAGDLDAEAIDETTIESYLYTRDLPPVDLMIRTSGEQRLSNFLLWQLAYSELVFTKVHWPAFSKRHLLKAIRSFQSRHRRFGGLKQEGKR